jgi:hypothetical protein
VSVVPKAGCGVGTVERVRDDSLIRYRHPSVGPRELVVVPRRDRVTHLHRRDGQRGPGEGVVRGRLQQRGRTGPSAPDDLRVGPRGGTQRDRHCPRGRDVDQVTPGPNVGGEHRAGVYPHLCGVRRLRGGHFERHPPTLHAPHGPPPPELRRGSRPSHPTTPVHHPQG